MKLICPKCRTKSMIADERVPASGAWARCPHCSERFFIRPAGQGAGLDIQPSPAPAGPAGGRSAEAQKLINRQRAKKNETEAATSLDGHSFDLDTITVFPQPAPNHVSIYLAVGLMIALAGFALVGSFTKASTVKVAADEPTPLVGVRVYGDAQLRDDLLYLRKQAFQRKNLRYQVTYRGYESRVYKYFLSKLAPRECQEITSLYIRSDQTSQGAGGLIFSATCLDDSRSAPDLHIQWVERDAVATMSGQTGRMHFTVFPAAVQAAEDETGRS